MKDEIINLQEERKNLLNKLQLLEEKKGTVKESVFNKVKGDYEKKLKEIEKQLSEKSGELSSQLEECLAKIKDIESQKTSLDEQLEEIDLRYSVGEYTEDQYNSLTEELKNRIGQLEQELEELKKQEEELSSIVGETPKEETEISIEEGINIPLQGEEKEDVSGEASAPEEVLPEVPEGEKLAEEIFTGEEATVEELNEVVPEEEAVKPDVQKSEEPKAESKETEEDWLAGLEKELGVGEGKEEEEYIVCPKCGFKNKPDAWYCENCGAELKHE